ncbi:hypothetical protein A7Q10_10065 [Methylacidiphilum caldifontis]|uniref:Uncharacterized protein n=1 Tax=Methylacidiphilum caldifontis TaxID=2795386 RepID=A0A4Y8P8S1_9BACT|nr:hypothetical protein A7Q10_10065 [Methylacidiphilum caldifontis]
MKKSKRGFFTFLLETQFIFKQNKAKSKITIPALWLSGSKQNNFLKRSIKKRAFWSVLKARTTKSSNSQNQDLLFTLKKFILNYLRKGRRIEDKNFGNHRTRSSKLVSFLILFLSSYEKF